MRYAELLNELIWEDRFTAAEACKKHKGAWIHFSNIPKLGINPKKGHGDPPGVYFYPCSWLLSEESSLSQYATEYPYYYVVRIRTSAATINLGRMTSAQILRIATRNGWLDDFNRIKADPSLLSNNRQPMDKKLMRKPGGFFYACMDYLANVEKKSWMAMLRGVDAMIDPGHGIIASEEPSQAIVFNPKLMTIVEHGDNKDTGNKLYAGCLKRCAEELGGRFYYKNQKPMTDMTIEGKPLRVVLGYGFVGPVLEISYFKNGFWITKSDQIDDTHGNVDHVSRLMKGKIVGIAQTADVKGLDLSWNVDNISSLIRTIVPNGRITQQVYKDELYVSCQLTYSSTVVMIQSILSKDDQLKVSMSISLLREIDTEVDIQFGPQTDILTAGAEIKEHFVLQLRNAITKRNEAITSDQTEINPENVINYLTKVGLNLSA